MSMNGTPSLMSQRADRPCVWDAHYRINYISPDPDLLADEEGAEWVAVGIGDFTGRYDPTQPLVEDAAVSVHASRGSEEETSIYLITKADCADNDHAGTREPSVALGTCTDGKVGDVYDLIDDIKFVSARVGTTDLHVVAYLPRDDHETNTDPTASRVDRIMLKFKRVTNRRFVGGETIQTVSVHKVPIKTLLHHGFMTAVWDRWLSVLVGLLVRKSDRAARHVAVQTHAGGCGVPGSTWRPARRVPYEEHLKDTATPLDAASVSNEHCPTCLEAFDNYVNQALQLNCDPKHLICKHCAVEWTTAQVVFGTEADGKTYVTDLRYNEYENFERSCADLDKSLASNNSDILRVDQTVLLAGMADIIGGAEWESDESTPWDMQPVRRPELPCLIRALTKAIAHLQGQEMPTKLVFDSITFLVHAEMARVFMERGGTIYLSEEEVRLTRKILWDNTLLTPDFCGFVDRTINRMLQFAHVRRCDYGYEGPQLHFHGLRQYFT